jgi:hypothetical protein
LLDVWKTAPQPLASEILRIAEVAVNMRTWGVWQKTSGSEEFELWKKKIAEACRGRTGMPSVKVVPSSIQREDLF